MTCNDIKAEAGTLQHTGQFGYRAGLAVSQPLASHQRSVAQSVQVIVVDSRNGLDVQQQHGLAHPLHHRQHGRREGVGGDEDADKLHLLLQEEGGCGMRLRNVIYHSAPDHLDLHALQTDGYLVFVAQQAGQQSFVLSPICI